MVRIPAQEAARDGASPDEVISARLIAFLDDLLAARSPNAGRFCGGCYHPLQPDHDACGHCGVSTAERASVAAVPLEIIEAHRRRRGREGMAVRSIAWGGLTLGVTLSLVPLAFGGVQWWTVVLFFGTLVGSYLLSANLANSVGDALGYRWGLAIFRRRWNEHVAGRSAE